MYPAATVRPGAAGCIGSRQRGSWSGAGALRFAKNCETNPITSQESGRIRGVGGANEPGRLLEQGCAIGCEDPLPSPARLGVAGTDSHGRTDHPNERLRRHG
jgi:hypothetical protein